MDESATTCLIYALLANQLSSGWRCHQKWAAWQFIMPAAGLWLQGHVAYPHLADNPIVRLLAMLAPVNGVTLDDGNDYFDASTAHVTTIDTGNKAGNVIPATVSASFNIRFNTEQKAEG